MRAVERFDAAVIEGMRRAVADAGGREVLFVGRLEGGEKVSHVVTAARGTEDAVPALRPYMERGDVVVHNHPSGRLAPSGPDLGVASALGNEGIGFWIVDNRIEEVYAVTEPIPVRERVELDPDALGTVLEPCGTLSQLSDGYEPRPSQVAMLRMVADGFNGGAIGLAEAGTGVGKSFAYLIPAFRWAEFNGERVVVSTGTINLQHQLLEKDIPTVRRLLQSNVKAVLVKGRGNYLCRKRLEEALEEPTLFLADDLEQLHAILEWSKKTVDGSRSDLSFLPSERVWSAVCSEADACMGLRCDAREGCFVIRARREAASAGILVVNHHLLFADLAMRLSGTGYDQTAVLPPFRRIIFDEAHNLEESATSYFSLSFSRLSVYKYLGRFLRNRNGRRSGLLLSLEKLSRKRLDALDLPRRIAEIHEQVDLLDAAVLAGLSSDAAPRITTNNVEAWRALLLEPLGEIQSRLLSFIETVRDMIERAEELETENPRVFESRMVLRRLEETADICQQFRRCEERTDRIFWLDRSRSSRGEAFVRFTVTPLEIAPLMREAVFDPYETVICTSATLSVNASFSFWKGRMGLSDGAGRRVREEIFPSPFAYADRVLLGIPSDAPLPDDPEYVPFLGRFVGEALERSGGSGLILFTSYDMLRRVYDSVKPRLAAKKISVFRQGEDDRGRLLDRFRTDTASVLFATDSFWEGVDAPGEALRMVVLCRLPFKVPTDPVLQARMEAIRERGGNPFMELSLPEAVMKFKQGFGRLMRRTSDRGVVLITDLRLLKKTYGSLFLASLPRTRRSVRPAEELLDDMEQFLQSEGGYETG